MTHPRFAARIALLPLAAALLAAVGGSAASPRAWQPAPGTGEEAVRVRIVEQGIEHQRDGDGHVYAITSLHRYRIAKDGQGIYQIFSAGKDFRLFHDADVDGDGDPADDTVGAHPFRFGPEETPMTPDAPFYDTTVGTQRFYGGATIYHANIADTGFSEDGMNDFEEGICNQPRRNWTLFRETYDIFSPFRMYYLAVWPKWDFMNGGAEHRVSFDAESELAFLIMRYHMGMEGWRWVVRNGQDFYISERVFQGAGETRGGKGGKAHVIRPAAEKWAVYRPTAPYRIDFDPKTAQFAERTFDDVTGVGWYMFKDSLISGYVGCKWYAMEADAVVHRPVRPSENLAMREVRADGVPPFWMSACEIPYELWRRIHRLKRSNTFVRTKNYTFDRHGDLGSMDLSATLGREEAHSQDEPVTDLTLWDMLAWCNALSEAESKRPCYYVDPELKEPFRAVRRSMLYVEPYVLPAIHVDWAADGYRLPTPAEWTAAVGATPPPVPAGSEKTGPVGAGAANVNGLHDLLGNVWEPVWTWGNVLASEPQPELTLVGDDFTGATPGSISASPWGDTPWDGNWNIGFRPVRRAAGLGAPPERPLPATSGPVWTVKADPRTAADPARQAARPAIALGQVPGQSWAIGRNEVTFAEWRQVADWAEAHGYAFDRGGEMGSMAYWGWGKDWQPGAHAIREPVTGITHYDALCWLNALSEWEGRTPAYYHDEACTRPYRTSYRFRSLMTLLGEQDELSTAKAIRYGWIEQDPTFVRAGADGYRLPTAAEHALAARAGVAGRYPWGDDLAVGLPSAWTLENSGLRTHPVGSAKANPADLYDLIGNVSEWGHDIQVGKGKGACALRMGLSFLDLIVAVDGRGVKPAETTRGLAYPDVGLRVLTAAPSQGQPAAAAPAPEPLLLAAVGDFRLLAAAEKPTREKPARQPRADRPARKQAAEKPARPARATAAGKGTFSFDPATFDPLVGKVHRGDLGRSGHFQATGVKRLKGIRWQFQTGGPVRSSPVVVDGILHVGSHDGHVYALDAANGALKWKHDAGAPVSGSAAIADGKVYVVAENGALMALGDNDGKPVWTTRIATRSGSRPVGSPAVMYGTVFIGSGSRGGSESLHMTAGPLLGFDATTGKQSWQSQGNGPQGYAAVATDGTRLFAGINGSSYAAFDLASGAPLWTITGGHQNRQFMSMSFVDGKVYIPTTMRGAVMCVNPDAKGGRDWRWFTAMLDGQLDTELNAEGAFGYETLTDVAVADGRVFAGCNDGRLYTFDAATGKKGWSFATGGKVQSSPAVADGSVYFGSWDGHLYALDAATGTLLWKQDLGARVISAPWPADGAVYVGCDNGTVYCLE